MQGIGNIGQQLDEMEESYLASIKDIGKENMQALMPKEVNHIHLDTNNLKYYNEYGGFSENGREYIIMLKDEISLPTVWSHVMSSENFGTVITESQGGYTWSKNSRLNKVTAWNNLPYLDIPSEILYIKDKETGKVWSSSSFISKEEGDFKITYGFGYSKYFSCNQDIICEENIFVPKSDKAKIRIVKLKNTRPDKRKLKLVFYSKLVLDEEESKSNGYLNIKQIDENVIKVENLSNEDFKELFFVGSSQNIISYTGNRDFFIGNGSIKNPEGINKVVLDGENSLGRNSILAIEMEIELDEFATKEFSIFIGSEDSKEEVKKKVEEYKSVEECKEKLKEVQDMWFELNGKLQVKTPIESMNIMLNGWLVYQTITSRLWARSRLLSIWRSIWF